MIGPDMDPATAIGGAARVSFVKGGNTKLNAFYLNIKALRDGSMSLFPVTLFDVTQKKYLEKQVDFLLWYVSGTR